MVLKVFWEVLSKIAGIIQRLWQKRAALNKKMRERYSPSLLALIGMGICFVLSVIILFVPSYIGVANDSIGNLKMQEFGLSYRRSDTESVSQFNSNEYFIKSYEMTEKKREFLSSQNVFVVLAKAMDSLFTRDNIFDVRFLALVYLALYLPAVFLVLNSALERVSFFTEGVVLCVLGVLIFSDISYFAYFNSLYEDALVFICLLYFAGAALSLHKGRKWNILSILIIAAAGVVLCLVEKRFFLAGMICAMFLFLQIRIFSRVDEKVVTVLLACVLLGSSVFSIARCGEEFDDVSKVHSMTRGVLLQAQRPDDVLEKMGIDVSYSVLADSSLYDYYPASEISNKLLQNGFLDKYSGQDVLLSYIRNPGALFSMWDIGIKAAFNLRRDYCSNYERGAGMPAMGKSIFWSMWSIFKERSAPKTIGYLLLLVIAFSAMSGRKVFDRHSVKRWVYVYFWLMMSMVLIGIADLTYVICKSGDAQLIQFNITMGAVMDILFYYVMAEILHKLNILEETNE